MPPMPHDTTKSAQKQMNASLIISVKNIRFEFLNTLFIK